MLQTLLQWIVDAIDLAYGSKSMEGPIGVRAHFTRGMAYSWAWTNGISIHYISHAVALSVNAVVLMLTHL